MHVRTFEWDEWNVDHIARHGLEPYEAEAGCRGNTLVLRGRKGHYVVYGRTEGGRYLFVILRVRRAGVARIITARDMTERERRLYHRRR